MNLLGLLFSWRQIACDIGAGFALDVAAEASAIAGNTSFYVWTVVILALRIVLELLILKNRKK